MPGPFNLPEYCPGGPLVSCGIDALGSKQEANLVVTFQIWFL